MHSCGKCTTDNQAHAIAVTSPLHIIMYLLCNTDVEGSQCLQQLGTLYDCCASLAQMMTHTHQCFACTPRRRLRNMPKERGKQSCMNINKGMSVWLLCFKYDRECWQRFGHCLISDVHVDHYILKKYNVKRVSGVPTLQCFEEVIFLLL